MTMERVITLSELLATIPPGHRTEPWTWEDEEEDIRQRRCLCCGMLGHYQKTVEDRIRVEGLKDGVCIGDDGRLHDGHHRVVAAKALGLTQIPLETREEADARGRRDHGTYIWELRRFGDVHAGPEWEHVQRYRQAALGFADWVKYGNKLTWHVAELGQSTNVQRRICMTQDKTPQQVTWERMARDAEILLDQLSQPSMGARSAKLRDAIYDARNQLSVERALAEAADHNVGR